MGGLVRFLGAEKRIQQAQSQQQLNDTGSVFMALSCLFLPPNGAISPLKSVCFESLNI